MFLSFNESKFYQLQQKSKKTFMSHCIHHSHVIIKNKTIRFIPQYNSFVQIRIVYIYNYSRDWSVATHVTLC